MDTQKHRPPPSLTAALRHRRLAFAFLVQTVLKQRLGSVTDSAYAATRLCDSAVPHVPEMAAAQVRGPTQCQYGEPAPSPVLTQRIRSDLYCCVSDVRAHQIGSLLWSTGMMRVDHPPLKTVTPPPPNTHHSQENTISVQIAQEICVLPPLISLCSILRPRYVMSGTDLVYVVVIVLRLCYAVSGTDIA
eukprot:1458202-Rhodomonas_salina.2